MVDEELRWPNGPACPHCGGAEPYALKPSGAAKKRAVKPGTYKCKACRKQFTATVGTVFHNSHVPLSIWLLAIHKLSASKKGHSALQLQRELGVTYKTAWFIFHRLRHAMSTGSLAVKLGGSGKVVEADETYVGGRRRGARRGRPGPDSNKTPVVALVERKGKMRMFPVERVTAATLADALYTHVDPRSELMTDDLPMYRKPGRKFQSHRAVKHLAGEYAVGTAHVNSAESAFSLLKRGVYGTFHHVSKHHLHRYCAEFEYRHNHRDITDGERTAALVQACEGRRLTYRPLKDDVDSLVG